jgi:hypothetical protein
MVDAGKMLLLKELPLEPEPVALALASLASLRPPPLCRPPLSATPVIAIPVAIAATATLAHELLDGLEMRTGMGKVTGLITHVATRDIGGTSRLDRDGVPVRNAE